MRIKIAVLLTLAAALAVYGWQNDSTSEWRAIYDAHDWFKLRDVIAGKDAPPLYRGAVAAAFNQAAEAAEALHPLINGSTTSKDADDADDWLSYMYVRAGQYQRAAAEMDPGTPLFTTLRSLPDQSVSKGEPSSVACRMAQHMLFIPVTIQGKQVDFFLDSDANFSFMSESQARSLGLSIRESELKVHGAGGVQTGFRTAIADNLTVGNVELKHVAFLVMADSEQVFSRLPAGQQGALGLPVLLAFRNIRYSKGKIDIAGPSQIAASQLAASQAVEKGEQNICFDGLDPVVRVGFGQQQLPVVLDTGAAMTEIWPPFARKFPDVVNAAGKSSSAMENSFGGMSRSTARILPELVLNVGGRDAHIRPARIFLTQTTPNSQRYFGRLGLDALASAHEVTIDFEALKLTLR